MSTERRYTLGTPALLPVLSNDSFSIPEGVKQQISPALKSNTYCGWLAPFTMILGFNHIYYQRLFQNNCGASSPKAPVKLSIPGPWSVSTRALFWPWALAHPGDKMALLHFSTELASPPLLVDKDWQPQCCISLPRSPVYRGWHVGKSGRLPLWSWSSNGFSVCWVGKDKRAHQSRIAKESPRGWLFWIDVRLQNSHLSGIVVKNTAFDNKWTPVEYLTWPFPR